MSDSQEPSAQIAVSAMSKALSNMRETLDNERAKLRAVATVCSEVEADDQAHLDNYGQHLQGSVVVVAEMVRAVLRGAR